MTTAEPQLAEPPAEPFDYLTYVNTSICPRCCEDIGSAYCTCVWPPIAAETPEIHIDTGRRT